MDNGGDCEDTAILAASIIDALGYGVVLLELTPIDDVGGHMAIGIKARAELVGTRWEYQGDKYYYLETTGEGWEIGQLPDEYKGRSARIYPMKPTAILIHSWETEAAGIYLELKVKVENMGSAAAENVYVYAGFDAGNDQCWNVQRSQYFSLGVGEGVKSTLYLRPPYNVAHSACNSNSVSGACR